MSRPLGNYSFLPWLRLGLANQIAAGANENGRAVVDVHLRLEGAAVAGGAVTGTVDKKVALYGPGDILGIERRAVVRTEPRDWAGNFEPNYLPAIEFYDEDFPWRYTPAGPDAKGRLKPWLALLVLEEKETSPEFADGKDMTNKPLPYIEVPDLVHFPPPAQLWAWAHVHASRSLAGDDTEIVSTDMGAVLPRLSALLRENADLALSRIVSPRKLDANKPYHAFLVPAFESGRRAGLGLAPYTNPALPSVTTCAWESYPGRPDGLRVPYYYRWYFHTGGKGDFESLVRLLQPRPVDYRVGRRDIDVQNPGLNVRGVNAGRPDLRGVLKLGGALQVPDDALDAEQLAEKTKYETWENPFPQPLQADLAKLVNLADDYAAQPAAAANWTADVVDPHDSTKGDPDPIITPPLYGRWHAMARRLFVDPGVRPISPHRDWVHELNLDPRFRAAAGFGTRVVQDQQETFMNAAWAQVGTVLESNRRIRLGQMARGATRVWYDAHIRPLMGVDRQKGLQVVAPLNKRVLVGERTVHQRYVEGALPPVATSGVFRRIIRPRGRTVRKLRFSSDYRLDHLFDRWNEGSITPAPPLMIPVEGSGPPEDPMGTPPDLRPAPRPRKDPIPLGDLAEQFVNAINPKDTIPRRVLSTVAVPKRIREEIGMGFVEAMAYPRIDTPMYALLRDISPELFLPNLGLISDNSVTLLQTNQKFIEAYMVGLNHELARELLWREYPTDQRGSYFRQFWDVSSVFNADNLADEVLKEKLSDIPRLDRWPPGSKLGAHDHRATGRKGEGELVLVIRGELLKRYPTAVIYAHRAAWHLRPDDTFERRPAELTETEEAQPPRIKVLTPMYDAKVDPDVYFFGFDLEVGKARGSDDPADADPGWFFVIKERPGEPRFGLDVDRQKLEVWSDLSWDDVQSAPPGSFLEIGDQKLELHEPDDDDKHPQYLEDRNVAWNPDMSAADLAYILFQVPVKVALHASEMLPPAKTP